MVIDGCSNTFAELAETVLPKHMENMRRAMQHPRPLAEFCAPGVGIKTIAKRLGRTCDFSGCYVILRGNAPFYVGISRGAIGRLRQHGTGRTQFDASLAYRMAYEKVPHKLTRKAAMETSEFRQAFEGAKRLLAGANVAFVEITNPLELYLFEAFCAMELDTCEWNTFRTH